MTSHLLMALALVAGTPSTLTPSVPATSSIAPAAAAASNSARPTPTLKAEPVIQPVPKLTPIARKVRATMRRRRVPLVESRVLAANRRALQEPQNIGFINAVQVYPWSEGALYRLMAAPGAVTDIALQSGEVIVSVAAGDTVRWTVGDTSSGAADTKRAHILVKPFSAGLSTNLVIATDRRTYHLEMVSTMGTAMAAISWTYPPGELIAIQHKQDDRSAEDSGNSAIAPGAMAPAPGLALDRLNFAYAIDGDTPAWRPLRAFDDGRQTFIEFPPSIAVGEAPPLFVTGSKGEAQLVNYRMSGHFYVVDRLFETGELRLGGKKQVIVRISRKGSRASGREGGKVS